MMCERQSKYKENMKKLGFSLVTIVVHKDDKEDLVEYGTRLREARKNLLLNTCKKCGEVSD